MECKWQIFHNCVKFAKGPCMVEMMDLEKCKKGKAERKSASHFGAIVPFSVNWALESAIGERKWYMDPGNKLYKSGLQVGAAPHTPPACGGLHVLFCYFKCFTYPAFIRWIAFPFLLLQILYISRFHAVDCFVFFLLPR